MEQKRKKMEQMKNNDSVFGASLTYVVGHLVIKSFKLIVGATFILGFVWLFT
jgi:hypothetical protein